MVRQTKTYTYICIPAPSRLQLIPALLPRHLSSRNQLAVSCQGVSTAGILVAVALKF